MNAESTTESCVRSLIWKPPPHFGTSSGVKRKIAERRLTLALEERIPGYITGYVRRFWQVRECEVGIRISN